MRFRARVGRQALGHPAFRGHPPQVALGGENNRVAVNGRETDNSPSASPQPVAKVRKHNGRIRKTVFMVISV